ncbi:hypothetical protein K7X08_029764 [Anisodus acutangulus]|uniref:Uncharacterized protein n=1 Tax=Anisodus acutangulus TaxID=402998 RepID=A0A9Q1MH13_9SOLA|nr:hypothetical protein K7X08_029764 [Anisodus acutangulus]
MRIGVDHGQHRFKTISYDWLSMREGWFYILEMVCIFGLCPGDSRVNFEDQFQVGNTLEKSGVQLLKLLIASRCSIGHCGCDARCRDREEGFWARSCNAL